VKAKDVIVIWLLVSFVLWALLTAFSGFADALNQHHSWGSILLQLSITLVVAAAGVFLIMRFTRVLDDLKNFEAKENQKEKDLIS
jgi:hypothetical protein